MIEKEKDGRELTFKNARYSDNQDFDIDFRDQKKKFYGDVNESIGNMGFQNGKDQNSSRIDEAFEKKLRYNL